MTFAVPQSVLDNQRRRALTNQPQPCGEGIGGGLTCRAFPARLYPCGWRCDEHLPQPLNPTPDPTRTLAGLLARQAQTDNPAALRAIRAQTEDHPATAPANSIDDRFRAFHRANPHVYARLVELVADAVLRGETRIGAGALFEQLRYAERTETNGDRYRLNNDFRAPYVRLLVQEHPEWRDLFETRARRAS